MLWRSEPYWSQLAEFVKIGMRRPGEDGWGLHFVVQAGARVFAVLPDRYVDVTGKHYSILPLGRDKWEVQFLSLEEHELIRANAANLLEIMRRNPELKTKFSAFIDGIRDDPEFKAKFLAAMKG